MSVVKIVILNWNGAAHLRRFLPSVVRTAPPGVEIVVADNGSTDGSAALVEREFPSVTLLRLPENYGFAGGYNRALERLEGDYWVLLNSDVEPATQRTIEVNIFNFDNEIYGKTVNLEFVDRVRDERRMNGLDDLRRQLQLDRKTIENILTQSSEYENH